MTKEEIENIDVIVFGEKAVVISPEDYAELWAYINQLQKENEKLKKEIKHFQSLEIPKKVVWAVEDECTCPNCGTVLEDDGNERCVECGQRLDWSEKND